jgi:hypothetical protein
MKYIAISVLAWSLLVAVHFLWEAWLIARSDFKDIPECRRWWCPHGIRNRWKSRS